MAQSRTWAFQDPASSRLANKQQSLVADPGPYAGYFPRVTQLSGITNRIDLTVGHDSKSVAITAEGVRIEEDSNLVGIVQFDNPNTAGQTRYDLVVVEYQYTTDRNVPAIYKVIKGNFAPAGQLPELPQLQNPYQVPLCYVRIRPVVATTGPALVQLSQTDLLPVSRGQDVSHPIEMAALKPIVDPSSPGRTRLFVYGGSFPSVDRQTVIDFRGGYSAEVDPTNLIPIGTTEYRVYGLTDAGTVEVIEIVASFLSNPTNVDFAIPLCIAEVTNSAGSAAIVRIRDIRQFVSRLGMGDRETDLWTDMFHDTYFQEMVFEPFLNLDKVNTLTFVDTGTGVAPVGVTLSLEQAITALTFTYDGVSPPVGDVEVVVGDFVAGNFSNPGAALREFLLLALHNIPNLHVAYSYSGFSAGFSPPLPITDLLNAPIISVPNNPPTQLFIKLIIPGPTTTIASGPSALFSGSGVGNVYSMGVLANIDEGVAARNVILNDQQATLENAVRNLIGNPFQLWSRPNSSTFVDPTQNSTFSVEISGAQQAITNRVNQFGPDGWQAVWLSGGNTVWDVSRVAKLTNAFIYDLEIEAPAHAGTPITLPLEYRVPVQLLRTGDPISFAVNVDGSAQNRVRLGIRFYRRPLTGLAFTEVFSGLNRGGFERLIVTTDLLPIDNDVVAIGFVIYITQSATPMMFRFSDPMAAVGRFSEVLHYSPPVNMLEASSHYVSVHRLRQRGFSPEPSRVGYSVPHPFKYNNLGELRIRAVNLPNAQNSINVASMQYLVEPNGQDITVLANSVVAGEFAIDTQVISEVLYEKV